MWALEALIFAFPVAVLAALGWHGGTILGARWFGPFTTLKINRAPQATGDEE